jgi:hypothetical protein
VLDVTPDRPTGAVRAEILDAVNRANHVWNNTTYNLNTGELTGSGWVAGEVLKSVLAEVEKLRSAGQKRASTNTEFEVVDITLDAPGHATVQN